MDHYPENEKVESVEGELVVFIVREWAYERNLLPWICQNLRNFGFDIKLVQELDEQQKQNATSKIRGGNWGAGPRPVSGGPPAALIVAFDHVPCPPPFALQREQPHLSNARTARAKDIIRKGINKHVPKQLQANPMHSSSQI